MSKKTKKSDNQPSNRSGKACKKPGTKHERVRGSGSVFKKRNRWAAQLPHSLGSKIIGYYNTKEEASEVLDAAIEEVGKGKLVELPFGMSLADIYAPFFKHREAQGIRSMYDDKLRWDAYIFTWDKYRVSLASITDRDVRKWRDAHLARGIKNNTMKNALNLLRTALGWAVEEGYCSSNPALGVRVTRRENETHELWTSISLDEQNALIGCPEIPEEDRIMIEFAIGTGLRLGEQLWLQTSDVHLDVPHPYAVIRYGSKGKATKNRKIRQVPLFGFGLNAAIKQMERAQAHGSVRFFGDRNGFWSRQWDRYQKAAGFQRHVRWHDLRHTCASSLVSGLWGRKWSLEEVKGMLGHSSINVTERYAHLGKNVLMEAAKEAAEVGKQLLPELLPNRSKSVQLNNANHCKTSEPTMGFEPTTYGLRKPEGLGNKDVSLWSGSNRLILRELALECVKGIAHGSMGGAVSLAEAVLNSELVKLSFEVLEGGPFASVRAVSLAEKILLDDSESSRVVVGGK